MATKSKSQPEPSNQPALGESASHFIDEQIALLGDWRGAKLAEVRRIILDAHPQIIEERKWGDIPVWSHSGIICTGETYKKVVKLTFARGAFLDDPKKLFNSSLEGNLRRAIDIREGESINSRALTALVQAAIAENLRMRAPKTKSKKPKTEGKMDAPDTKSKKTKTKPQESDSNLAKPTAKPHKEPRKERSAVTLLTGGNPQIAKGEGDAPVQAYIAALTGWKGDFCKRIDALISRTVPRVRKAVKWNSPFYGMDGQGWFLSFHVFTHYLKVTFFRGLDLKPIPSGGTERSKDSRWIDIRETDSLDQAQMTAWVKQAAALPGWKP